MNELNALVPGFVGGFIGGTSVICSYYYYIFQKTKQYIGAKNIMKDRLVVAGLEQEIHDLKVEMNKIHLELYRQYDESTKQS